MKTNCPTGPIEASLLPVAVDNNTPNIKSAKYTRVDPVGASVVASKTNTPGIDPDARVPRSSNCRWNTNKGNV